MWFGVSYIVKPSWQKQVFFHKRTRDISLSSNMNLLVFPTERFLDQDKNYQLWRIIPAWLSLWNLKMICCTIAAPITASQLTSTVLFGYTLYVGTTQPVFPVGKCVFFKDTKLHKLSNLILATIQMAQTFTVFDSIFRGQCSSLPFFLCHPSPYSSRLTWRNSKVIISFPLDVRRQTDIWCFYAIVF